MTESETSKTPARLQLDPGHPRKRNTMSGCRCLLLLIGLIFLGVCVMVALFLGSVVYKVGKILLVPHSAHYLTGNETLPPHLVVRPLIDANQTFDVAITVWARADPEAEKQYRMSIAPDMDFRSNMDKELVAAEIGYDPNVFTLELFHDDLILEIPVYSDIAFRGLRLTDKDVSTTIKFRIPTSRFHGADLTQHDLRASFVLIPSSPSLADHITDYSSWFPFFIKPRPRRAWPFPLGSADQGNRTLVDHALDSFGLSIPLIEFHTIPNKCSDIGIGVTDEGSEAEGQRLPKEKPENKHPFVITRTQLRIVPETHLLNRTTYDLLKNHLWQTRACHGVNGGRSRHCRRDYRSNGHWETLFELSLPVPGKDNETDPQTAYPPYLSVLPSGFGPLDLVAVPVDRENCSNVEANAFSTSTTLLPKFTDAEFMDITWRVSVSGRSPFKMFLGDLIPGHSQPNHTASEEDNMESHSTAELLNGIRGQRFHDDAHPRRRAFIAFVSIAFFMVGLLFNLHYWYSRINIVGISVFATSMRALSLTLGAILGISGTLTKSSKISLVSRFFDAWWFIPPFLMVKAITGMEIRWWRNTTWIPVMRRIPLSHKERASMRLDAQTSWRVRLSVLILGFGFYHFAKLRSTSIIPARLPISAPYEKMGYLAPQRLASSLLNATENTGVIVQLLLNWRSRHFAGWYNVALIPFVVVEIAEFLYWVPSVAGRVEFSYGVSIHSVLVSALTLTMAWQAMTLPNVPQNGVDEDEE